MTEPNLISQESGSISSPSGYVQKEISEQDLEEIKATRARNRMTITETVTYNRENGKPFQVSTKCARSISQDTQPYQREIKVTEEWKPIDLGWAVEWESGIGIVHIEHLGETLLQRIPTVEEKLENSSRSFYIALGIDFGPYLEYYPKDAFRAILSDARALRIRSKSGTIRCLLTIFPA